jgi:hypothetical protein
MKLRANVNTPWARRGEEFNVHANSLTDNQAWALHRGTLTRLDSDEDPPELPFEGVVTDEMQEAGEKAVPKGKAPKVT